MERLNPCYIPTWEHHGNWTVNKPLQLSYGCFFGLHPSPQTMSAGVCSVRCCGSSSPLHWLPSLAAAWCHECCRYAGDRSDHGMAPHGITYSLRLSTNIPYAKERQVWPQGILPFTSPTNIGQLWLGSLISQVLVPYMPSRSSLLSQKKIFQLWEYLAHLKANPKLKLIYRHMNGQGVTTVISCQESSKSTLSPSS